MKKNNTAEKTIRNAEEIAKALKESTEKSMKELMNEALENLINDDDEDEEPKTEPCVDGSEDSCEVEDVNTDVADSDETPENEEGENAEAEDETPAEDADDEWSDMEDYKVGDNDYDFTGVDDEDGEMLLKVYNKLGDDDQIFVKKDENADYEVKDEETGAEYVIKLDADAAEETPEETPEDAAPETDGEDDGEELTIDLGGDETDEAGDDFIDIQLDGEDEDADNAEEELKEEKNMMVNDYQKDVMPGLNMNEPADKKITYSMDDGAPEGNKRPYGKKGDDDPFNEKVNENVNECGSAPVTGEEATLEEDGQGLNTKHAMKKSTNRLNKDAQNQHVVSDPNDATVKALRESAAKIFNKAKEIQAENKKYEACIDKLKKAVYEAATLNVNMGQVIKLLVNETTTAKEKKTILERFNNVKTIKEGKALYETIKMELNENKKSAVVLEKQISAKSSDMLNETTIYQNRKSNPALDLMDRMDNLFK